ncbi:fructosamine kinase family protein [Caldichromatium japonicum]|uniref:Fructosamine kinase family protein n=1 Tax=Caldichromatium japonicum TaxID=2699430 RepID=A0A6G7VED6_9GAMM|nr:fructosamine kinase family protein [Caldichromatium japonicum]QIK38334.1 fructosamine kinase family protein [Caldichromatium japonicum]
MTHWEQIAEAIGQATGENFVIEQQRSVGGGCINHAAVIEGNGLRFFVKLNRAQARAMFEAECAGLDELRKADAIRVPRPICTGVAGGESFLAMEYLDLSGRVDGARAGCQLAELHRVTAEQFGWTRDNTIGATPQINTPYRDWASFWRECRLGPQLRLAAANGYGGRLQQTGERLMESLTALLDHRPAPSLLHGDLWGGNIGATPSAEPVIFDPAVYYGDREADLAMTELFGGFDARFYAAYRESWSLDPGYGVRKTLYNLYHILNHLNLFGGGYLLQAQSMIERLLAELS